MVILASWIFRLSLHSKLAIPVRQGSGTYEKEDQEPHRWLWISLQNKKRDHEEQRREEIEVQMEELTWDTRKKVFVWEKKEAENTGQDGYIRNEDRVEEVPIKEPWPSRILGKNIILEHDKIRCKWKAQWEQNKDWICSKSHWGSRQKGRLKIWDDQRGAVSTWAGCPEGKKTKSNEKSWV